MLEQHLTQAAEAKGHKDSGTAASAAQRHFTDKETAYSKHAWNINNLPRCKVGSLGLAIKQETCQRLRRAACGLGYPFWR